MIKKPTTSKVMDVFTDAVTKTEEIEKKLDTAKTELDDKISLLDTQYEYALSMLMNLKSRPAAADGKIIFGEVEKYGLFDTFGMTIHPKLSKTPRNLFNYLTTRGYLFKDNVEFDVNEVANEHLKESLKEDSIQSKKLYIDEFDTDILDITIKPDLKTPLGSMKCNVMEILPFLPGSFNIEYINFYSRDNLIAPAHVLAGGITNVGAQRITLSSKVDVGKIEMRVKLLYKNSKGKYPFGLHHLYFLEANFLPDSYVIVRTDRNKNINYIYDKLSMKTQYGFSSQESSAEWGIRYYASYDGENLSHEIETSTTTDPSYVSANTKTAFIYVPLTASLLSITPDIRTATN